MTGASVEPRSIVGAVAELAAARGPDAAGQLLTRTERWRPEQLVPHQLLRLQELLRHALENVPFYRERAADYRLAVEGELDLERWARLPISSREQVLEHSRDLRAERLPPRERVLREARSSGSTGRPVSVAISSGAARVVDALAQRDHRWHQRDKSLSAAAIRALPEGTALARVGAASPARWSSGSGPLAVLEVHTPTRRQLHWLRSLRPAYLATYASNAHALLQRAAELGVSWPELRELGTFGEVVSPELRQLARTVWDVPLVDAYSCVELGQLALQCPEHPHYHVQSENVLLELLRPDGSPAAPGELGRVVVSALHNFAMPLVRYELGDMAIAGAACDCGRGLPVLERIVGRVRNLLRVRSAAGEDRLWPRYASNVLGSQFPVRQFRLVQVGFEAFRLELVAAPLGPEREAQLRRLVLSQLQRHLPAPASLSFDYVAEIARGPGGKFEDFVCRFEPP